MDVDSDDDENKATVIIALMQKHSRQKRIQTRGQSAEESIGFKLFRVRDESIINEESMSAGVKFNWNHLEKVGDSGVYINKREVTKRFRVDPGYYVIVPSTFHGDRNCEFMIRILTEVQVEAKYLRKHNRINRKNNLEAYIKIKKFYFYFLLSTLSQDNEEQV